MDPYTDATELARQIRSGEVSPVELVAAQLERIDRLNPGLNAVVSRSPAALDEAREAERVAAGGEGLGPLHGVPFTVKDTFDTAGLRTTRGSLLFAARVPVRDAAAVARLRAAGGILLGKTNTPEFALWWETGNRVFGTTSNPWDATRTPGGSTGGEAAALAAGLTPLGLGSDLGGSIRLPAHCCGVVGFKPSHGLVPLTGHWPDTLQRFMHAGPLARSVRDARLALSILAGPDGVDFHALPVAPAAKEGPLRVGLTTSAFGPVVPEVAAAVRAAGAALAALGHAVDEVELPWLERNDWNRLTMTLFGGESGAFFARVTAGREGELHRLLQRRLSLPAPSLEDYVAVESEVEALRRDLTAFFAGFDLLLCPVAPVPAWLHEQEELTLDGIAWPPRGVMRATVPFDLTGSPALALPFGWSGGGLPVGVQLVGRRFEDGTVLRAGEDLEALRPEPEQRRPM